MDVTELFMSSFEESEGVVILLDSLGSKGIWKTRDPQEFLSTWEGLISTTNVDVRACKDNGVDLKFNAFSDTMIITLTGEDQQIVLEEAGTTLSSIIPAGIPHGIYFRGCFSMGKIYRSGTFVLGEAIDEAATYYEKSNWIGAFSTSSVSDYLNKITNENVWKDFIRYDVPFHDDKLNGTEKFTSTWAVILPNRIAGTLKKNKLTEIIPEQISQSPPNIRKKWQNTLDFIKHTKRVRVN